MIIAIQGQRASFHDIGAGKYFGAGERLFCESFTETIAALTTKKADYSLCAIENSIHGSIDEVYELIAKHNLFIVGELYIPISQCLIGLPGSAIESISSVYSHPVALSQCEEWLTDHLPYADKHEYHDTAASVGHILELADEHAAAIASKEAAELYELPILASSIETDKENYTRFVVIANELAVPEQANKTSLLLKTDHTPGALYTALGAFAKRSINLSKIESRPILGKAWHYKFYVDVGASIESTACKEAFSELSDNGFTVQLLGSYKSMH